MSTYYEKRARDDRWVATGSIPKRMLAERVPSARPRWGSRMGHLPLSTAMGDPSGTVNPQGEIEELMMQPFEEGAATPTVDIDGVREEMENLLASLRQRERLMFHFLFSEGMSWEKGAAEVQARGFACTKWQMRGFKTKMTKELKERMEKFL